MELILPHGDPFLHVFPLPEKNGSRTVTKRTYSSVGWKWAVERNSYYM